MTTLHFFDLFGTAAFAISGVYMGARKGMDITGILLVAFVVGNAGGTLRDILLNNGPVFWFYQHDYIWVTIISAIAALLFARFFIPPYRLLLLADAVGLGVFMVIGAEKALMAGRSDLIAILMGLLTGIGGGIVRDIICHETPLLLRKEIYATAALVGVFVFIVSKDLFSLNIAIILAVGVTVLMRAGAIFYHWTLPAFSERWFKDERIKMIIEAKKEEAPYP